MGTGTGKTWVACGLIAARIDRGQIEQALVIVPLSVRDDWQEVIDVWGIGDYVTLMTFEEVRKLKRKDKKKAWCMIVVDESQRIKSRSSKQSRVIHGLAKYAMYRVALTGTPIEQDAIQLWSQFKYLDRTLLGYSDDDDLVGDRWLSFKSEYCRNAGFMGYKIKVRANKLKSLLRLWSKNCWIVDKRDVLDMPAPRGYAIKFELSKSERRVYDELEREFTVQLSDGTTVTTPLAVTNLLKLQQLTGGRLKSEDEVIVTGNTKLSILRDFIQDRPKKTVIFCKFRAEVTAVLALCRRLGYEADRYDGTNRKTRDAIKRRFLHDPRLLYMVCQSEAGGVGLNLQSADMIIHYSLPHSWIAWDQANGRIDRDGQTKYMTIVSLLAKNTVDEDAYEALQAKTDVVKNVIKHLMHRGTEMAKPAKKTSDEKPEKKEKAPKADKKAEAKSETKEPKEEGYGVAYLAKSLGKEPATVRVLLRKAKIEKPGKSYNWSSKAKADEVAKKLAA